MKHRVDFYLTTAVDFKECRALVCSLADKGYQKGHSAIIRMESEEDAHALDRLLWTFQPERFLPHQIASAKTIQIAKLNETPCSLVINVYLPLQAEKLKYTRLLQIVPNQPNLRHLARQHYRFYKQEGYQLFTHQIK